MPRKTRRPYLKRLSESLPVPIRCPSKTVTDLEYTTNHALCHQRSFDAKRHVYDPCPLVGGVPIPDYLFLHYMNCPNPSSKDAWLRRLPKKLNLSITYLARALSYGWGIHINEGANYSAIAWTNMSMLLLSGVGAVLWTFFRQDFSRLIWLCMLDCCSFEYRHVLLPLFDMGMNNLLPTA